MTDYEALVRDLEAFIAARDELLAQLDSAKLQLKDTREERDRLREWKRTIIKTGWLTHFEHCAIRTTGIPSGDGGCTCGLDAALASQEQKP
jgi:hypothetical protein